MQHGPALHVLCTSGLALIAHIRQAAAACSGMTMLCAHDAQTMKVDSLPFGRKQPFYNVLVDAHDRPGGHTTYVAQVSDVHAPAV